MKIAIIGNMNNNGFALMRYFRDLGVDAHVFSYANDGEGTLAHFNPEADTWQIQRWGAFCHKTKFISGYESIVGIPKKLIMPPPRSYFDATFDSFTHFVGTGIAPALFYRFNKRLDIFTPHGVNVEFLGCLEFCNRCSSGNLLRRAIHTYTRRMQEKGLRFNTTHILSPDHATNAYLLRNSFSPKVVAMPMVYNREMGKEGSIPEHLTTILSTIKSHDFVVTSHASQDWLKPPFLSEQQFYHWNKRNNWLIEAFATLVRSRGHRNPLLVLFEYGANVSEAKALCSTLGIENNVLWVSKMARKYILIILKYSTIGVGEFTCCDRTLWGGTGWEVLASGKPLLQDFHFKDDEFEREYGYKAPPLLGVKKQDDIYTHLIAMMDSPESCKKIGHQAKAWFEEHNGIGLAAQWVQLLSGSTLPPMPQRWQ